MGGRASGRKGVGPEGKVEAMSAKVNLMMRIMRCRSRLSLGKVQVFPQHFECDLRSQKGPTTFT